MNLSNIQFQLKESLEGLQTCMHEIETGTLSERNESGLSEHLGRVLDHICLAWNTRDLATHVVGHMSRRDIDRFMHTIPNFGGAREIGEPTW